MNDRLIVIAGMARGGTNLLWNLVQSHPDVIDSYFELNEILSPKTGIGWPQKAAVELEALAGFRIPGIPSLLRERLTACARRSFEEDPFNRERSPGVPYADGDFDSLTVCTKLVSAWETDPLRRLLRRNDALKYVPLLERAYRDVKFVFLVRHGLSMAEGWGRRGADVDTAAYWYRKYVEYYEGFVIRHSTRALIVRFEDLLADPFAAMPKVFAFLGLPAMGKKPFRIALKPTVRANRHLVNTTEKTKVWIEPATWQEHLDAGINEAQIAKLPTDLRHRFMSLNQDVMARLGYC